MSCRTLMGAPALLCNLSLLGFVLCWFLACCQNRAAPGKVSSCSCLHSACDPALLRPCLVARRGTDVAFIPDAPAPLRAKSSQPAAAPSAGASSTPGSSQAASPPAPLPAAASLPASPQGTRGGEADDARQSTELQRPSDVRWLRSVSSMPSSPVAASSAR